MVNIIGRAVPMQPQGDGLGSVFETLAKPFMDTLSGDVKRSSIGLNAAKTSEIQQALQAGAALAELARNGQINSNEGDAQAILAGKDSKYVGGFGLNGTLRSGAPLQGDAVARGQLARGDSYGTTGQAFAQEQADKIKMQGMQEATKLRIAANELEKQRMQEATKLRVADSALESVDGPNGPTYVRRSDAVGQRPLLSTDQVRAREATSVLPTVSPERRVDFALGTPAQKKPSTYVVNGRPFITNDGVTDAQTGAPLPRGGYLANTQGSATETGAGGDGTKRLVADRRIGTQTALAGLDNLDRLLSEPNANAAVGWLGQGASMFNNARAQVEAAVQQFAPGGLAAEIRDPSVVQSIDGVVNTLVGNPAFNARAQALGIQANVLRSQIQDLAYTLAKAYDPEGRMSNQDVERAGDIIGRSIMDPVAGRAVLKATRDGIVQRHMIAEQEYNRMFGTPVSGVPGQPAGQPAPAQAAQPAPAPAPTAPPVENVPTATGPGGQKLYLRNGQWSPQ